MERQNSEDSYNLILGGKPNLIRESRILSELFSVRRGIEVVQDT